MTDSNQTSQPAGNDREDNTSLPMEYIIRHGIGVSVPAPHPAPGPEESPELVQAVEQSENKQDCPSRLGDVVERLSNFPEPVEQGEQTLDKDCKCCGYPCREFLCDYCFRERLMDSFHQCKTKPSTTAPSQPELPPMKFRPTREYHAMGLSFVCGVDEGRVRIEREAQLLESLRENQQLRQQVEASRHAGEVLMHTSNANFDRFKVAEQQLAQIRDATFTTVGCWECPNAIQAAQTIAALKADNAQKDARIAELEGGKK